MPSAFLPMLVVWCVAWTIAAGITLLRSRPGSSSPESGVVRTGFWSMTLLWIAIDLAIVVWALVDPVVDPDEFRRLLLVNGGLDVVYLVVGVVLVRRPEPLPRGFGIAVLVQGAFLLVFDLAWWLAIEPTPLGG